MVVPITALMADHDERQRERQLERRHRLRAGDVGDERCEAVARATSR